MTLNPGCSVEELNAREFSSTATTHKVENDGDLRTYRRRGQTSGYKRKSCCATPSSELPNLSDTDTEVEKQDSNCRKHETSHRSTPYQPKKLWFDLWKPSYTSSLSKSNMGSKKTVAPKPKRVIGQYFLDLGQKDFSYSTCSVCGLFYARGLENDEVVHRVFHKNRTQGIRFKGWQNERVVSKLDDKGNRVIVVLPEDTHHHHKVKEVIGIVEVELGLSPGWLTQKACKVYLFISSSKKIVGCLMAEPIKHAFRVLPSKKQDVGNSDQQVYSGPESWSTVLSGERPGGSEATEVQDQTDASVSEPRTPGDPRIEDFGGEASSKMASVSEPRTPGEPRIEDFVGEVSTKVVDVSDVSDVGLQPVTQNSAHPSSSFFIGFHTAVCSTGKSVANSGEAVLNSPSETLPGIPSSYANTKSRTWKMTDFFEQLRTPAEVGKDNAPSTSDSSSCLNPLPRIHIGTSKDRNLAVSRCRGAKPSKISDYFSGMLSKVLSPESLESLEDDCEKAGVTVTIGSTGAQEGKEHGILGKHMIKLENLTEVGKFGSDASGHPQLEKRGNFVTFDHELKDTIRCSLGKCFQEQELGPELSSSKYGVSGASCVHAKLEIREESNFQQSAVQATIDFSGTAVLSGRKGGVQIDVKDEILPKRDLDAEQDELRGEKVDDSSGDMSVQKKTYKQIRSGANVLQQFGNVKLCREVIPRKRSRQEHAQELGSSAIMYNTTPFPAVCGAKVIWVSNSERRKGIASHLLDAMRKNFCLGVVLEPSQFAFSQPTTDGRKFAERYCKTDEFLVYTTS